jgi:D-glycero-D-manno-heptose 1,7-bisphosphate phosphatase
VWLAALRSRAGELAETSGYYEYFPGDTVIQPAQAVILAGGRGTRMAPLTDTCPKAMIEIQGKPFLEYLIEMLRDQGVSRVLILLGYLPEVVQQFFGDGSRWGVKIEYSVTPIENETGPRLKAAIPKLDPYFLLLYCDNYWPMSMDKMWKRYSEANVLSMITIYSNMDRYTTNNVRVDEDGYVTEYVKGAQKDNLQGVEIGYALLSKTVVETLPESNVSFEATIYPRLAEQHQMLAYVTHHRYYSIGSYRRLPLTEAFFERIPTVLLDRDGVLNKKPPRAEYVRTWAGFDWLPGAQEALKLFYDAGYRVILVSNQAGIARGAMTEADLAAIHERMKEEAVQAGGRIDAIYHCPHGWDDNCDCRKPKPGMLFQAQRDHHLDLTRTLFIGDDERDAEAADAAGCLSHLLSGNQSLLDVARQMVSSVALFK